MAVPARCLHDTGERGVRADLAIAADEHAHATGVIGERTVAWRYGMGCRLKNSHIIGLALKSVTP